MDLEKLLTINLIHENFEQIAEKLLCGTELIIAGSSFSIAEIEFYVYDESHPDIFTHCNKHQRPHLRWYFHRASDGEHSYKGGTFKGLDITCGHGQTYGGILIRSIIDNSNKTVIDGPCKVVNKILDLTGSTDIKNLVIDKMKNNVSIFSEILHLKTKEVSSHHIFRSPRIGLTLKKSDHLELRKQYIAKLYRFTTHPSKISKGKKMTYLVSVNQNSDNITISEFGCKQSQIDNDRQLIEKIKASPIDFSKYMGIDLDDSKRVELLFSQTDNFNIGNQSVTPKIKITLKKLK